MAESVDRAQVIAYRVAAHQFDRASTDLRVFDLGVSDSERSAAAALAARLAVDPDLDDYTATWTVRGAPHLHRPADFPALAARVWPLGDADAIARMSRPRGVASGLAALTAVASALREVVTAPMTKGEASRLVTPLVPPEVTAWCRGCDATHVQDPVFRLAALPAGLVFDTAPKTVTFVPTSPWPGVPSSTVGFEDLLLAYLRLHGPAGPSEVAGYFGTTAAVIKEVWPSDLAEVRVDGRKAWLPADQVPALLDAPDPDVVRLLPPLDPYLQARDRDLLVPDKAAQKEVWRILGRRGAIVVDGEVTGTWQAKAAGKRLDVTLRPFGEAPPAAVSDEAQRLARVRGLASARVVTA
ncbi:winged helix DNA-binding domain-containing protein [Umezawaea sp. Da 62-37]|uniref:winged helix DNA-binding domain-containing protein n=1 Tax=Umezawaea sp. Da 62-37 TaxID=3075927 RepID=UPI0028F73594|nr:winged helix DNA-binding domain-containing protein [Umezawaea sp. Da 62-37]WNV82406.1 winged helix DNA-binding domain-containing protein [Umezawaea sp. Da 62-37]